ncbi:MAG: 1-acyl-sn-glycerol-3-phosphate acyltransferase [Rhodocyclaceae bacterium]|nr:1-acyl-sn-glycerol-3-phosphate acyltransferase [Rhodocyclaceae bacterium]
MNVLRSTLFMLILIIVTPPWALLVMLSFPLPHHWRRRSVEPWVAFAIWLVKHLLGIPYRLLGKENIPDRPMVIFAKHQSAWETLVLQEIFKDTLFVWKKELKMLPFFGWALAATPMISIDRRAGKDALKQLVDQGRERLGQGYSVIIFPEGTRVAPGKKKRYKIGGAHLAVETGAPLVPVALNSGEFWGRNAFYKTPGMATVSIGPAIDPTGLSGDDVNRRAEAWMEAEMRRISPHLYPAAGTVADEEAQPPTGPEA